MRIWEIPEGGLKRNMTEAVLELYGHSRRVGIVEWHPTTNNILLSAGYDYKVRPAGNADPKGFPGLLAPLGVTQIGTVEFWNGLVGRSLKLVSFRAFHRVGELPQARETFHRPGGHSIGQGAIP